MLEHSTQVGPDQLLKGPGRDVAGRAAVAGRKRAPLRLGAAQIISVSGRPLTAHAAVPAVPAAHQPAQKIRVHPVVPPRHLSIVHQPLGGTVELLLCNQGRYARDWDLLQSWGPAEKPPWQGPDQAAIPNRPATKVA